MWGWIMTAISAVGAIIKAAVAIAEASRARANLGDPYVSNFTVGADVRDDVVKYLSADSRFEVRAVGTDKIRVRVKKE